MSLSTNILAEQSVYARLVVKRIAPVVTPFQNSTENNDNTNASRIYEYYALEPNLQQLTTNANTTDFSIITLPDTLAYLPRYSIFDYLLLIVDSDPDYRRLRVTSKYNLFDTLTHGPSVTTVRAPTVYSENGTTNALNPVVVRQGQSILMSTLPADLLSRPLAQQPQQNNENADDAANNSVVLGLRSNDVQIDARYNNLTRENIQSELKNLSVAVFQISNVAPDAVEDNQSQPAYINELLNIMNVSMEDRNYAASNLNNEFESWRKNNGTVKAYYVHLTVPNKQYTADQLAQLGTLINRAIDAYEPSNANIISIN